MFHIETADWAGHQPGMVANRACDQSPQEGKMGLSPFVPEDLISRDRSGRPVPRKPAHSRHPGWIWCLLMGFFPSLCFPRWRPSIPPTAIGSVPTAFCQVTELRTDSVHRRESAGTGPEAVTVASATGVVYSGNPMDQTSLRPTSFL